MFASSGHGRCLGLGPQRREETGAPCSLHRIRRPGPVRFDGYPGIVSSTDLPEGSEDEAGHYSERLADLVMLSRSAIWSSTEWPISYFASWTLPCTKFSAH